MAEGGRSYESDELDESDTEHRTAVLVENVEGGKEPRFDVSIIAVGHLMAGKTTLIGRLLLENFDMSQTKSTNGIIILHKGAMCIKDGEWITIKKPEDLEEVLSRMQRAKARSKKQYRTKMSRNRIDRAYEAVEAVRNASRRTRHASDSQDDEGPTCRVHFMDFAGQSVLNSTHQMFMTHRAIYLLVLDISRALESEVADDDVYCLGANRRMTVEDLTEFLMRSIHVYRGDEPDSYPKVLLVGTHKDLVEETTANTRMDRIVTKFKDTPLEKHVVGYFIVDCSTADDPEIDKLRQSIFKIAKNEPHWGIETPTRWLPLEHDIIKKSESGERVLTLQTIRKMNKECFVRLHSDDEIEVFLRFCNDLGNLMYFGGSAPDVLVILDPQWLVDALKQIITHKQFFLTPRRVKAYMKEFMECAKLEKKLIEAVWSRNKDKTFITHMKQLLIIMEQTDVISTPLTYNKDGKAEDCSYYFVPTMLKPYPDGKAKVEELLEVCRAKSPPLYFVFVEKFMQPAIFSRLQAECTSIYRIKKVRKQPLLFHQVAVLQLNQELDLVIEHVRHAIKVTIINEKGANINPKICENVRLIIDDSLQKIVRLYRNTTVPYHMAVQCKEASADLDKLITWSELETSESTHKEDVLGPWFPLKASDKPEERLTKEGSIAVDEDLGFLQIGRLARRLSPTDLLLAARTAVTDPEREQCKLDNIGHVVGAVFDTMVKWRKRKQCLTLLDIHGALEDAGSDTAIEILQNAVADTDLEADFLGFNQTFLGKKVSDEAIDLIAKSSPKTYRFLALELGLEHRSIENVVVVQDIDGVTHSAKKLLMQWRRGCSGTTCTFKEIGQAILKVDKDIRLFRDCEVLWMASDKLENRLTNEGRIAVDEGLGFLQIGRLARRLHSEDLLRAARTAVTEAECKQSELDNRNHVVGEVYDTMVKWRKKKQCLTLQDIHEALEDVGSDITIEVLQNAVADTDLEKDFKGFNQTFLGEIVSDEAIDLIAQRSPNTYRFLALELGLEHSSIETVVQDIDGLTHRAKKLLMQWRHGCSRATCTFKEIGQAILEVDKDIRPLRDCEVLWVEKTDKRDRDRETCTCS